MSLLKSMKKLTTWCAKALVLGIRTESCEGSAIKLRVVETVTGYWFYHLAREGEYRAICDPNKRVMNTNFKLADWGMSCGNSDVRYKWCKECQKELPDR